MLTTNDVASGSNENAQLLITNPAGSGKRMDIYLISTGTNVSSNNNIFRFYSNPTVTNPGAIVLAPSSLNIGGNSPPSAMSITRLPTVSSNGTLLMNICQGPTSTDFLLFPNCLILHPGNRILVTVRPNAANVTNSINLQWEEE